RRPGRPPAFANRFDKLWRIALRPPGSASVAAALGKEPRTAVIRTPPTDGTRARTERLPEGRLASRREASTSACGAKAGAAGTPASAIPESPGIDRHERVGGTMCDAIERRPACAVRDGGVAWPRRGC